MMLNPVYLQLLIQLFQIPLLPERKHCCRCGWKQIDLHRLRSCSDWRRQSSELSSHCSPICRMTPYMLTCFPAEPLHVLFWQKLLHDPAQLQNCFFLLGLVFWVVLLPLLGNQFISCCMDWSICHFDAFSHTKYFIHNFLRVLKFSSKFHFLW